MAERIAPTLAELRALLGRIDEHRLEADDWAVVDSLVAGLLDQAEPGQEWLSIELSDEEDGSGRETGGEDAT